MPFQGVEDGISKNCYKPIYHQKNTKMNFLRYGANIAFMTTWNVDGALHKAWQDTRNGHYESGMLSCGHLQVAFISDNSLISNPTWRKTEIVIHLAYYQQLG